MKRFRWILLMGGVLAALFTLAFLLLPKTDNLLAAYLFCLVAVLFLVGGGGLFFRKNAALPLDFSFVLLARNQLFVTVALSAVVLLLQCTGAFSLPTVWHVALQLLAFVPFGLRGLVLCLGKTHMNAVEADAKEGVQRVAGWVADVDALKPQMEHFPSEERAMLSALLTQAAEALRYSDPISHEAVRPLDQAISATVAGLGEAVRDGDAPLAKALIQALLSGVKERNTRNRDAK